MTVLHEGNRFLSHLSNERHEEYLQSVLHILAGRAIGKSKTDLTAGYGTCEERGIRRKKGARKAIIRHHENGTQRRA